MFGAQGVGFRVHRFAASKARAEDGKLEVQLVSRTQADGEGETERERERERERETERETESERDRERERERVRDASVVCGSHASQYGALRKTAVFDELRILITAPHCCGETLGINLRCPETSCQNGPAAFSRNCP